MSAGVMKSVADQDAAWFALHPRRTVRVRPFVEGEMPVSLPSGDGVRAVIVQQIHPGVRSRVPIYLQRMPADTEAAAQAVQRHHWNGGAA